MTQQPEFTPRRGSVSSHYEAPQQAPRAWKKQPKRPLWQPVWPFALGVILVLAALTALDALFVGYSAWKSQEQPDHKTSPLP